MKAKTTLEISKDNITPDSNRIGGVKIVVVSRTKKKIRHHDLYIDPEYYDSLRAAMDKWEAAWEAGLKD